MSRPPSPLESLAQILTDPIPWTESLKRPALAAFLDDLQANILKGHGRNHAGHVFISFAGMPADDVATLIRTLGLQVTSALAQLRANRRLPPYLDGGPVRCLFLSASGYRALGEHAAAPPGEAFQAGMAARKDVLADPPRTAWQAVGWAADQPAVDAMFLIADDSADAVTRDLEQLHGWLNGTGARVLVVERGNQQHRRFEGQPKPAGVEHFGYVDGRSQPLFLAEDLALEQPAGKPVAWDATFAPQRFIVPDTNSDHALAAGSYFVFRKLEQDVRGFKAAERALGEALFPGQPEAVRERAGAMVVGRFENGTPFVVSAKEIHEPPPNNFNFDDDKDGLRCPFHAHIRKTNPRGDVRRTFGLPDDSGDRNPIMARRGITYGVRERTPDDGDFAEAEGAEPSGDVGLLFMAYMHDLEAQFEFTQQSWANNAQFVKPNTGIDPIIGQGAAAAHGTYTWPGGIQAGFGAFVHMKGGEYFFAPSRSFLLQVGL